MPHPFEIRASSLKAATPDELVIFWGNTPPGSTASLYLPALDAAEIRNLARSGFGSTRLTVLDPHTLEVPVGGVTFVPVPRGTARNAGLLTVDLPAGVKRGEIFNINIRQITEAAATSRPAPPPPRIGVAREAVATDARTFSWRRQLGAFQVTIVISTKELLLFREERLYAWLLFLQKTLPPKNRWVPVFQRYVDQIAGRVRGFGGNPNHILPSPTGDVPRPKPDHDHKEPRHLTGKVMGLVYDRFGDFDGFLLLTEHGHEHTFRAREHQVEQLVHRAWIERILITVFFERYNPAWPASIVLRHAPKPYEH